MAAGGGDVVAEEYEYQLVVLGTIETAILVG